MTAPTTLRDFLGRDYGVGDTVVYAAGSGRSITMVFGEVVKIHESGAINVQPLDSARWVQHHGSRHYVDTRTGKRIDPYAGEGRHYKVPPSYRHRVSGEVLSSEEYYERRHSMQYREWSDWEYTPVEFADYVQEVKEGPKPVTLQITENVVRVDRPEVTA